MLDKNALERLYTSYGFDIVESKNNDIAVFVYKKSRYFGVDIVPINLTEDLNEKAEIIKESYSKLGYAANIRQIRDINDAESELFKSFFNYDSTSSRIEKKYKWGLF